MHLALLYITTYHWLNWIMGSNHTSWKWDRSMDLQKGWSIYLDMSPKSEDQRRLTKEGELLSYFLDTMGCDVQQSNKNLRNWNKNSVYSSKILAEDSQGYSKEKAFTNEKYTFSNHFKALTLLSVYPWWEVFRELEQRRRTVLNILCKQCTKFSSKTSWICFLFAK